MASDAAGQSTGSLPMPEPFSIELLPDRGTVYLAVAGELDAATAPQLRERLEELAAAGFARLVLDVRAATFIDSMGLAVIVRFARQRDNFAIIPGSGAANDLLRRTGLLERLPSVPGAPARASPRIA